MERLGAYIIEEALYEWPSELKENMYLVVKQAAWEKSLTISDFLLMSLAIKYPSTCDLILTEHAD